VPGYQIPVSLTYWGILDAYMKLMVLEITPKLFCSLDGKLYFSSITGGDGGYTCL